MSTELPPQPDDLSRVRAAREQARRRSLELNPPLDLPEAETRIEDHRQDVQDALHDAFSEIHLMLYHGVQLNEFGRTALLSDRQRYIGYIASGRDALFRQVQVLMIDMMLDPAEHQALRLDDYTAVLERAGKDPVLSSQQPDILTSIIRHTLGIWLERDYLAPADTPAIDIG